MRISKNMTAIEARRLLAGLSREEVARRIKRTRMSLYLWETGQRGISDSSKRALAKVYGCTLEDLEQFPVSRG